MSDLFRGLQADVVEAASNALLGVAGMSLDPSLGPIMSPRPVPMLVTRCIHTLVNACMQPSLLLRACQYFILVFTLTCVVIHCSQG